MWKSLQGMLIRSHNLFVTKNSHLIVCMTQNGWLCSVLQDHSFSYRQCEIPPLGRGYVTTHFCCLAEDGHLSDFSMGEGAILKERFECCHLRGLKQGPTEEKYSHYNQWNHDHKKRCCGNKITFWKISPLPVKNYFTNKNHTVHWLHCLQVFWNVMVLSN